MNLLKAKTLEMTVLFKVIHPSNDKDQKSFKKYSKPY
jgi:hypothetical protein